MDYEIYDQVLAYTLERGDNILLDGQVYKVFSSWENEVGTIYFELMDEWGDTETFPIPYTDIVPLVQV